MTQLTSTSLPGAGLSLCPFEGCILVFNYLSRARVTLLTTPFNVGTNWAVNNQSRGPAQHGDLGVPTPAARPNVCLSAPLLALDEQLPYWGQELHSGGNPTLAQPSPSTDRKEAIMFKHPHYEPQVSCCGSPSIKGFNRWRKRGRGSVRAGAKGRLETVLFLYWFESWLPLAAPQ